MDCPQLSREASLEAPPDLFQLELSQPLSDHEDEEDDGGLGDDVDEAGLGDEEADDSLCAVALFCEVWPSL